MVAINPISMLQAMAFAKASIEERVAGLFGEKTISLVGRERMVKAIAKLDADNRYLALELYCASPQHEYFAQLSDQDREMLEMLRKERCEPDDNPSEGD
jgi:hypothetical protein